MKNIPETNGYHLRAKLTPDSNVFFYSQRLTRVRIPSNLFQSIFNVTLHRISQGQVIIWSWKVQSPLAVAKRRGREGFAEKIGKRFTKSQLLRSNEEFETKTRWVCLAFSWCNQTVFFFFTRLTSDESRQASSISSCLYVFK